MQLEIMAQILRQGQILFSINLTKMIKNILNISDMHLKSARLILVYEIQCVVLVFSPYKFISCMRTQDLNQTFTRIKYSSRFHLPPVSPSDTKIKPLKPNIAPLYKPASYDQAVEYENKQCYRKKISQPSNQQNFVGLQVCGSNYLLKQSGLGVYFYLKFIWSLMITFILMSAASLFPLMVNNSGSGLSKYSSSFSIRLAQFTLGNLNSGGKSAYLMTTLSDIASMIIFLVFYLYWRSFQNKTILQIENNHQITNPKLYALSVVGFQQDGDGSTNKISEEELERLIYSYFQKLDNTSNQQTPIVYNSIHQVSIVYDYKGHFDEFAQYERLIQTQQKQKQLIRHKSQETLEEITQQKLQVQAKLIQISQQFQPIYAIVHFKTLEAKQQFLNYCRKLHLQDTFTQNLIRCLCCVRLTSSLNLLIRSNNLSRPQQINWRNVDLTKFSFFGRWVVSILLVIIFIAITSAIIVVCIVIVASQASCQDVLIPLTTSAADCSAASTAGGKVLFCFCNQNIQYMYTNSNVEQVCSNISAKVLMTNALQISASIISVIINFILSVIVTLIAKHILRCDTIPNEHNFIFWVIFISNFINSCMLPLILNGNIYGVKTISYLQFLPFINGQMSAFNDFNTDWYAMVSPYYLNLIVISSFISPIVSVILSCIKHFWTHRKVKKLCQNEAGDNPVIQKQVNKIIIENQFSLAEQQSHLVLILFIVIMYSGLIPLMIPIFTIGLIIWYYCKRTEIVKFSVRVPADESLSKSTLKLIPFMILAHSLFSIWSHTSSGVFDPASYIIAANFRYFNSSFDRIFQDILTFGQVVVIALIIILNFTVVNTIVQIIECCKDELQMPGQYDEVKNLAYADRVLNSNITKSYSIRQSVEWGSAFKAFRDLKNTRKKPQLRQQFS